jgi:hypothetical protein
MSEIGYKKDSSFMRDRIKENIIVAKEAIRKSK